jgi:hypothetical protein
MVGEHPQSLQLSVQLQHPHSHAMEGVARRGNPKCRLQHGVDLGRGDVGRPVERRGAPPGGEQRMQQFGRRVSDGRDLVSRCCGWGRWLRVTDVSDLGGDAFQGDEIIASQPVNEVPPH